MLWKDGLFGDYRPERGLKWGRKGCLRVKDTEGMKEGSNAYGRRFDGGWWGNVSYESVIRVMVGDTLAPYI